MEKSTVIQAKRPFSARRAAFTAMFAALIAVGAFIRVPIPYIAFSMQTLFVAMAGMFLGAKDGVTAVAVYIAVGLLGLPVFTQGGGIGYVLYPSFGYLVGFLFYALLTGYFTAKLKAYTFKGLLLAQLPGLFLMYAIALPYYYFISNFYANNPIGVSALFTYCFFAMLPGEALKCSLAAWAGVRTLGRFKVMAGA